MVHMLRPEPGDQTVTQPEPASPRLFLRYPEPFTSPYAFHFLVVNLLSDLLQQSGDPPVPVPAERGCQSDDIGLQGFFIVSDFQDMALGGSWLRESTAGPSFRDFRVNLLNALNEHTAARRA